LGLSEDEVLALGRGVGLNPALEPLMAAWSAKEVAVVQGVGYKAPNRSHFRSIDIWETGSDSDETLTEGWLASGLRTARGASSATGIVLGDGDAGPLRGSGVRAIVTRDPRGFGKSVARLAPIEPRTGNPALDHIARVHNDTLRIGGDIDGRLGAGDGPPDGFSKTRIGRSLQAVAELLNTGMPLSVVRVTHGGFDTHQRQRRTHDKLLGDLADGLAAFRATGVREKWWDNVMVMTYSEFGRRVAENASGGTDHGTAAPHFILGGAVRGGLYGKAPSLTELDDGDLRFTTDFRRLYATASRFLGLPSPHKAIPCL
jgi:uncharacterized protein (DUF1501 family)